MVTTKEEEEEHVMHPKEAEDDDIEDSDSDFDPIGFGIEERIRQVQSWFFFPAAEMIYLIQGRRNVKNIGSGQAYVVGEAKVKSIAIENIFYIEIFRIMHC